MLRLFRNNEPRAAEEANDSSLDSDVAMLRRLLALAVELCIPIVMQAWILLNMVLLFGQ